MEDLGADMRMILEKILGIRLGRYGLYASGSGWGAAAGSYEHGNKSLSSIKSGKFVS
jgi:hypothetical protein